MFSARTSGSGRAAVRPFLHPFLSSVLLTPSCPWTVFVLPEHPICTQVPILPNASALCPPPVPHPSCSLLASAHLREFSISLCRRLLS